MARTSQAQKQRMAEVKALKEAYVPPDNVIKTPVDTLEQLLAIYPPKDCNKDMQEYLQIYWKNFDFSLVDKVIFAEGWSNYDEAGFLCVFLAIDGSIQFCSYEHSPMCSRCDEDETPFLQEITPAQAKREIDSLISTQDNIETYYDTHDDYF